LSRNFLSILEDKKIPPAGNWRDEGRKEKRQAK